VVGSPHHPPTGDGLEASHGRALAKEKGA
jgi:hypothetical protein